jgi:hypothetical protein
LRLLYSGWGASVSEECDYIVNNWILWDRIFEIFERQVVVRFQNQRLCCGTTRSFG